MSFNNVGHLITSTITTLQHFATLVIVHCLNKNNGLYLYMRRPIRVGARSKTWVFGRSLAGIVGSNHSGSVGVCLL